MDDLKRKKRTRGGHRSFVKKTLGEVKGLLSNPELERETLYNRKSSLEEQLGVIQTLDNDIVKVLEDKDETEEAVIANEIEEAGCKGTTTAKIRAKQRHTKDAYKGITEASTSLQRPRTLYDATETHHRGLKALNVEQESYSSIVVPAIIDKLPETVRLSITRGKKHDEWNMDDLLSELLSELELREEHWTPKPPRAENGNAKGDLRSASALIAKSEEERCAYCLGRHAHESCDMPLLKFLTNHFQERKVTR
ncbi:E3 ubiquitin- ligase DZIP3 [Paramuricea clavata]|uniref:E3 ubiquitin- ligase DZIP3 n=1 Tax=Paramuricea clavata TaxID=317549 RepID=A0A7D9JUH4_PARCT|nr:E3 ubiquitin- ligase DZIP3 [Paramuricea clavata]